MTNPKCPRCRDTGVYAFVDGSGYETHDICACGAMGAVEPDTVSRCCGQPVFHLEPEGLDICCKCGQECAKAGGEL